MGERKKLPSTKFLQINSYETYLYTMTADMLSTTTGGSPATKTITIRPSSLQPSKSAKNQQIIVIPHSMLVNGCISAKDLNNIIQDTKPSIKSMENRTNLKRPSSSGDSTYGTDSEEGSSIHEGSDSKPVRKRANLDHLSPEEKLMRRKLKNRVAAQNARDKKRVKMEDMETDVERLRAHTKALEARNAQLVSENERLVAENDRLRSERLEANKGQESSSPLVVRQSPESAELTNGPQQQDQGCRVWAGGPLNSTASLATASKLLLNVIKANRRQKKLPIKKRARWPT